MPESIWYEDPRGFVRKENLLKFWPLASQTYAEVLNASLRLAIYYGAAWLALGGGVGSLFVPLAAAAVTYVVFESFRGGDGRSSALGFAPVGAGEAAVAPTRSNPFMNALPSDDPSRPPALDVLDPDVKRAVDESFQATVFQDIDDVWSRNNAGRAFYTMPSTTVPNDQASFAEWLYSGVRAGGKQTRAPSNSIF